MRTAVPILAGAVAVTVAACGSSSQSSTHALAPPGTTATTATTPAVKPASKATPKAKPKPQAKTSRKTTKAVPKPATTPVPSTRTTTTTQKTTPVPSPPPPAFTKPMRATLTGQSHSPVVGKLWYYTVTATDANGRPLSGTTLTEFVYGGAVVGREAPPTHTLTNGHLRDGITFPPRSEGVSLDLQVVVTTPLGKVTLDWAVTPRK